ncbi:hypothetical protein HWX41_07630 [Bacillus paramycoides]|uniref:hypothetical protein n=1 Tax=Bacillus paramycoides TaxID=2026194 RepID=UPI0015B83914|nr:hypothetical protein [Bacillus paramycoides]NWK68977.1 hypothetical protein [Bacillus paramycoides]
MTISQVKKALYKDRLKSKVVTYYKKREQEHTTFPNVLELPFESGKKIPNLVCDITEFRLINGKKVYFCAALDSSTRLIFNYSLDTCQDSQNKKTYRGDSM